MNNGCELFIVQIYCLTKPRIVVYLTGNVTFLSYWFQIDNSIKNRDIKNSMQEFTNDILDTNALPRYEGVELSTMSNKYWNVALINISIFLFLIGLGLGALLIFNNNVKQYLYLIATAYIAFAALLIFLYRLNVKRRGFALREKDIIYRSGIIAISTTVIPFSRIQHIALDEGIFSRIYGLGELKIFTAGGSSGSLHIPGIEIEQAKSIKELLMKQINETD